MQVTGLSFRLNMFLILLLGANILDSHSQSSGVRIVTDRQQFFEYESITFHCEGSSQLRRIRNKKQFIKECDTSTGTCSIGSGYESDTGEYWCETDSEKSSTVNITVTAGSVILESPVSPVEGGSNVTLRCRNRTNSSSFSAAFYKDGTLLEGDGADEMTIRNMSKSDEGLYKCS
ncbi:Fc receptor-like protein 5, partial [Melanotaenia boesemani]|uniref:Fc receptor-like protein 5 n=1 Tax=Melanotaenia boesemani TaxID=1250792 RepID=UPI001C057A96